MNEPLHRPLPFPEGATHRSVDANYVTVAAIPAPAGMQNRYRHEDGSSWTEPVPALLLQELRSMTYRFYLPNDPGKFDKGHQSVELACERPYLTRVTASSLSADGTLTPSDDIADTTVEFADRLLAYTNTKTKKAS